MKINIILIVILILFSVKCTDAQTLDSLINEAMTNNPQLKALGYKVSASEYRSETVNNLPPPTLAVEFSQVPIDKYNLWDNATSNSISISQMFHLGGKLNSMSEVEKKNSLIERSNIEINKVSIISQLRMKYYTLWLNDRKIEIQKNNIELMKQLLNSLNFSYSINSVSQADILTLKSEIASAETQLLILIKQRDPQIYGINKLLGRKLESTDLVIIREMNDTSFSVKLDILEEKLLSVNPALTRMDNMVEMNKVMVNANRKEMIPDLMLQGMFMRMPQGMALTTKTDLDMISMVRPKTEYMYSIMASITLPFVPWAKNKIEAKEDELISEIKSIELEKYDMQRDMLSKLRESFVKYTTSKDISILYSEKVLPLYKQALQSQISAYQNNKATITTIIDSYKMLIMQEMNYYMAQADMQMAKADIEMMVGEKL
jgi:outer membrane protein TolC